MINILVLLLQMLLGFFVLSVPTLAVFLNIDCGSLGSFTDANNITWVGDEPYIKSGKSETVPSAGNSPVAIQYTTRRVFPTRNKNCYSIDVGKGERVLLRAYFYYGNCNNSETSSTPTFDLHFDGNRWGKVDSCRTDPFYYEVIYLTKFDAISVCVARTSPDHQPFISAIQVISLDLGMYGGADPNYPLFFKRRINYGGDKTVRFPIDKYDRIWYDHPTAEGFVTAKSDTRIVATDLPDKPPEFVLQTALYNQNLSGSFSLTFSNLTATKMYTIFYFSELLNLNFSDKRSFSIYINGENISHPIIPPYKSALELNFTSNTSAYEGGYNATYYFYRTSDSTLPPILNALELFQVGTPLTDGTDNRHVRVLSMLQQTFVQLQNWSGDPCLPNGFPWDWVLCSINTETPQITALNLSNYGLQGSLPDFSALDTLQLIDLSNNSLSGEIPSFLGNLPSLNMLNLANNSFSGLIPSSLTNNNNLTLVYSGNVDLCAPNQSSCDKSVNGTSNLPHPTNSQSSISKNLPITIGIVISVLVLVSY
ncbi:PREDICTED: probable LRR receptor-like serine/threonine-protein kinase At5g59680 [Nelumbo nucifera]|uniref:Malectin-like domain-containing protein n=2 Tax=Nelumbo nucifera TaxID=4432 RepID=A0A822ZCE3_NELNU|nr:PREDICTED: probable LRR receptor-like serine/threonine-protein kinase At5g59680 [Nelumbo nucifera]DAD42577.1 TPA_asm: hypothetical protein HUJ06_000807 [Nelumbo nucifera]